MSAIRLTFSSNIFSENLQKIMESATKFETYSKMDSYENNKVLPVGETPSYEEYFGHSSTTDPWWNMNSKRYLHLAKSNSLYLLLPKFERVKYVGIMEFLPFGSTPSISNFL